MSYQSEVLADSPVLYVRFAETSGATCANSGSLGGNATAHGTFTRNITGYSTETGVSIDLNGTIADYVDYPDNSALDLIGAFTYECWLKPDGFTTHQVLMTKGLAASNAGYELLLTQTTRTIAINKAVTASLLTSTGLFPNDGAWHHVAATRTGNTYTIYIDGVSAGTGTNAETLNANNQPFMIGARIDNATRSLPLNGAIDEVAVYNTALSAGRIAAHYAAATPGGGGASAFVPQITIL